MTFANRATLCAAGSRVCTAAEWVARRGTGTAGVPTYDYWTNDVLYAGYMYGGNLEGDHNCEAHLTHQTLDWCDSTNPMRVCVGGSDPLGNTCNWTQCGYNTTTPQEYFGGCQSNPTAGALCCPN